jgi:hypothetical protein
MGVNHGRAHVAMPEQFLNRADVVARDQQVRGKRMAQRVAMNRFEEATLSGRGSDGFLWHRVVEMVPPSFSRAGVHTDL